MADRLMAFWLVRDSAHLLYGPASRRECLDQMHKFEAEIAEFHPGSIVELFQEVQKSTRRKPLDEEQEIEQESDMIDELLSK